jgi:hypothetical protein
MRRYAARGYVSPQMLELIVDVGPELAQKLPPKED